MKLNLLKQKYTSVYLNIITIFWIYCTKQNFSGNSLKVVLEVLPRNTLRHLSVVAELERMLRARLMEALRVWWMAFYFHSLQVNGLGLERKESSRKICCLG